MGRDTTTGNASPSPADGDGVRVIETTTPARASSVLGVFAAIGVLVAMAVGVSMTMTTRSPATPDVAQPHAPLTPPAAEQPIPPTDAARVVPPATGDVLAGRLSAPPADGDPDDLAAYFREGDDVPDTGNLIRALNEAGIKSGIAAFNPPGTLPPLEGLAVPDDFELPPGYVRHYQATDEGEPIPPILMFAPDLEWRDGQGRRIALPANRVVPRDMAPPGLPVHWVRPGQP